MRSAILLALLVSLAGADRPALAMSGASRVLAGASVIEFGGFDDASALEVAMPEVPDAGGLMTVPANGQAVPGAVTRRAHVTIQAPDGMAYNPSLQVRLSGRAIAVSRFQTDPPLADVLLVGHHDLGVGATIALPANLPPGRYVESFDLTVQYN